MDASSLTTYIVDNGVEELLLNFVERLVAEKPVDPKRFWLELLQEQASGPRAGGARNDVWIADVPAEYLKLLLDSTRRIVAEILPNDTVQAIIRETLALLACDRVSLFMFERRSNMLVLTASNALKPVRVKLGQGIVGHVFKTQETVNIEDCYEDPRFDSTFDQRTGYRTQSLLAMPILDYERQPVGVLQAINKLPADGGPNCAVFTAVDELLLAHLAQHAGIAYRNAELYSAALQSNERASALLAMLQSFTQDLGFQSIILTITMHASHLVQADRCSVFVLDQAKDQLWTVATDTGKEIRIPIDKGIAGETLTTAQTVVIPDAYADERFNQQVDQSTGYRTHSILSVPLKGHVAQDGVPECLGVIQLINKLVLGDVAEFDDEDVVLIETFAQLVASRLATWSLFLRTKRDSSTEASKVYGDLPEELIGGTQRSSFRQSVLDSYPVHEEKGENDDSESGEETENDSCSPNDGRSPFIGRVPEPRMSFG